MTVSQAQQLIRSSIGVSGEARAIERLIFEEMMNLSPVDVAVNPERTLPSFIPEKLTLALDELKAGKPIQYILGHARFFGMDFAVTPDTLIPRPETEQLIDLITDRHGNQTDLRILDIGTGSGCIAIALARALRFPQITAIDLSPQALEVARKNAATLHAKVNFIQADALSLSIPGPWDIIVSNPPYVLQSEAADMQPQVLNHEPHSALFVPDSNPMLFYDAITAYARKSRSKALYYEINPLCSNEFPGAEIIKDIHARNRFAIYDPLD